MFKSDSNNHKKSFIGEVKQLLQEKRSLQFLFYLSRPVNEIIYGEVGPVHLRLMDDTAFNEDQQYLKRYYHSDQLFCRLDLLLQHYNKFPIVPNLIPTNVWHIIKKMMKRRKKLQKRIHQEIQTQKLQINSNYLSKLDQETFKSSQTSQFANVPIEEQQLHDIFKVNQQKYNFYKKKEKKSSIFAIQSLVIDLDDVKKSNQFRQSLIAQDRRKHSVNDQLNRLNNLIQNRISKSKEKLGHLKLANSKESLPNLRLRVQSKVSLQDPATSRSKKSFFRDSTFQNSGQSKRIQSRNKLKKKKDSALKKQDPYFQDVYLLKKGKAGKTIRTQRQASRSHKELLRK